MREEVPEPPPLLAAYPRLAERVAWLRLGRWPTPVIDARRFAGAEGLGALYVKREDLSHPACGGNKVRGLELILGAARRRGAKTLITIGTSGSHHVCRTAWHARALGIDTLAVVVPQPDAAYARRNRSAALAAGATYVPANYLTVLPKLAWRLFRARAGGRRVMVVPAGGTSPLACLGHVNAALELRQQIDAHLLPAPDCLYAAAGSLGTVAGLAAGLRLAGLRTRIVGVVASYRWYCTRGRWARLAGRTLRLMRRLDPSVPDVGIDRTALVVVGTALGAGYARENPAAMARARRFFECEGIRLDGTYTSKALHGALQFMDARRLRGATHLLWHTFSEMGD